jgi:hypothetical protein
MKMMVPPGGFAGFSQMTAASRQALNMGARGGSGTTRRRKAKRAKATTKRRKSAKAKGTRKLKFGSPAWRKKYMKRKK